MWATGVRFEQQSIRRKMHSENFDKGVENKHELVKLYDDSVWVVAFLGGNVPT